MNLALTAASLIKALTPPSAPTVADLDRWERTLADRPYRGIATKMEACFLIRPSTSIHEAKRYLTLTRERLSRSAKLRPERFDPNRLFCAKAMLSLIERYERAAAWTLMRAEGEPSFYARQPRANEIDGLDPLSGLIIAHSIEECARIDLATSRADRLVQARAEGCV